jgi:hypothetical protein
MSRFTIGVAGLVLKVSGRKESETQTTGCGTAGGHTRDENTFCKKFSIARAA